MGVAISLDEILTAGIIALTDRSVIQIAFTTPIAIAITVVERYKFGLVIRRGFIREAITVSRRSLL
jgi:hypothetical protein